MPAASTLDTAAIAAGSIEAKFLSLVQAFDSLTGAQEWAKSSRLIALSSALVLLIIHLVTRKKYGLNWFSLSHSLVVGGMSFVAVWLNIFAAESLTGTTEPLGGILCQGPLTTFHSIVPAITMGYGLFDLGEALHLAKTDFVLHGIATASVMSYFCEYGVPEIITPMLLMELSTINLVFMGASEHMSQRMTLANIAMFTLIFTTFRMIVCPYLWWEIFITTWENRNNPFSQACLPWHFPYVVFAFGMFFNCLNSFWFYKIIKKILRKVSGSENWKAKNHVKDS